ncbi:MAG: hypothetical protein SGPRY_010712, partial [Prymnesium sp.]
MAGYGPLVDGEVVLPVSSERVGEWDLSDVMRAERDGLHLSLLTCQRSGASPATQPKPFKSADPRPRKLCRHTIKVGDQERSAALVERIQNTLHTTFPPRRLLCIINPMAGGRKAEKMFDRQAKPVLESAGAMLDVRVTTAAGDATAWAYAVPLHSFDGIAVVGGDGTVNEVIDGLTTRADSAEACAKLALAHLGGGTSNAVMHNIAMESDESSDMTSAAYLAVRGKAAAVDAARVWVSSGRARPLVLSA